jgi:hypothetical protein
MRGKRPHEAAQVFQLCAGGVGDFGDAYRLVTYRIGKLQS